MPVLHKHSDRNGYYIAATFKGNSVTYQLKDSGVQKLKTLCFGDESTFPEWILDGLKLDQEVYTINPSKIIPEEDIKAQKFPFADEVKNGGGFPVCDRCSFVKNLHFVVHVSSEKRKTGELCCTDCLPTTKPSPDSVVMLSKENKLKVLKQMHCLIGQKDFTKKDTSKNAYSLLSLLFRLGI
jgi:hypothetical protein